MHAKCHSGIICRGCLQHAGLVARGAFARLGLTERLGVCRASQMCQYLCSACRCGAVQVFTSVKCIQAKAPVRVSKRLWDLRLFLYVCRCNRRLWFAHRQLMTP